MQIQPVINQPKFEGKIVFERGTTEDLVQNMPDMLSRKIKEANLSILEKPYDVFISRNRHNPKFYDVAANKSFEEAQKIKEYTVKVQSNVIADSIVDAVTEAVKMYEKYIIGSVK